MILKQRLHARSGLVPNTDGGTLEGGLHFCGGSFVKESVLSAEAQAAARASVVESYAVGVGYSPKRSCS